MHKYAYPLHLFTAARTPFPVPEYLTNVETRGIEKLDRVGMPAVEGALWVDSWVCGTIFI